MILIIINYNILATRTGLQHGGTTDRATGNVQPRERNLGAVLGVNGLFLSSQRGGGRYLSQLRSLAEHCNYGTKLDEMLRDRSVCGVEVPAIQKRLLAEPNLH